VIKSVYVYFIRGKCARSLRARGEIKNGFWIIKISGDEQLLKAASAIKCQTVKSIMLIAKVKTEKIKLRNVIYCTTHGFIIRTRHRHYMTPSSALGGNAGLRILHHISLAVVARNLID